MSSISSASSSLSRESLDPILSCPAETSSLSELGSDGEQQQRLSVPVLDFYGDRRLSAASGSTVRQKPKDTMHEEASAHSSVDSFSPQYSLPTPLFEHSNDSFARAPVGNGNGDAPLAEAGTGSDSTYYGTAPRMTSPRVSPTIPAKPVSLRGPMPTVARPGPGPPKHDSSRSTFRTGEMGSGLGARGGLEGMMRDRAATLATPAPSTTTSVPSPPFTAPISLSSNPKRRSLGMPPPTMRFSPTPAPAAQMGVSPPPTPPHHSPTFPLRPTAVASQPAQPPSLPPRNLQRDASNASSSDSSRSSALRGKITGKLAAWTGSSSSTSAPKVPPPRLPAKPSSSTTKLPLPTSKPSVPSSRLPLPGPKPSLPPPIRSSTRPPQRPQNASSGSFSSNNSVQGGFGGAAASAGNMARDLGKMGWNRVEKMWGHRKDDSTSSGSEALSPLHMSHFSEPLLPKPLRVPTGRTGQLFGRTLEEAVRRTRPVVVRTGAGADSEEDREKAQWLPAIVLRCMQHLEKWGIEEEGIFRISGMPSHVAKLREDFDRGADYNLRDVPPSDIDPHAVASVFKAYLRELPETLLTLRLAPRFDGILVPFTGQPAAEIQGLASFGHPSATPLTPAPQLLHELRELLHLLPPENLTMLKELSRLLKVMSERRATTRMGLTNLLLVICPSVGLASSLVKLLVEEQDTLFRVAPRSPVDTREDWEKEADDDAMQYTKKSKARKHFSASSDPATPGSQILSFPASITATAPVVGTPPSRRNSLHPTPSTFTTPSRRRIRAASAIISSPVPSPGSVPPSAVPPLPPLPPRPPRTPSPPPRLALQLPSPTLIPPMQQSPSRSHPSVPTTPSRANRLFTDLFGSSSSKPAQTRGAPPRVSIMGKFGLKGDGPGRNEEWSQDVLQAAADASSSNPQQRPDDNTSRKRSGGRVRAAIDTIEEGAGSGGESPRRPSKLVRPREKERTAGNRGAFFPFN